MKKLIPFYFLLLAALSCQDPLIDQPPRSEQQGNSGRDTVALNPGGGTAREPDLYATAFCFPDGVQWQAGQTDGAEIILFKNGKEKLRVPVQGRPDPDRHRLSHGRLWTDACDGHEVVVSRDGVERFRYEGDELLRGFLATSNFVYTLGQRQGREGLSFRVNGEERFSSPTGTILGGPDDSDWEGGAFCYDTSGVYYTYGIPIRKGDELNWEYRVMREDEPFKTIPAGYTGPVFDIRIYEGMVYRSELRTSMASTFCLVKGDTYYTIDMGSGEVPHYCKLVPVRGKLLLKGYSTGLLQSGKYAYWLRDAQSIQFIVLDNLPVWDLVTDGEHTAHLIEGPSGTVRSLFLDKQLIPFTSDRFNLPSSRCVEFRGGVLGVALSCPEKGEHLLIRNQEKTTLQFNGYFTSIEIY